VSDGVFFFIQLYSERIKIDRESKRLLIRFDSTKKKKKKVIGNANEEEIKRFGKLTEKRTQKRSPCVVYSEFALKLAKRNGNCLCIRVSGGD